jgi:trehalose 6-phosphate synthase
MLRHRRNDVRIGLFLHIPFPPQELFSRLPWRRQLLEGMLGADVIGFQTKASAGNFLRVVQRLAKAELRRHTVQLEGRGVMVGAFPISIDFEKYELAAQNAGVLARSKELRQSLGRGRKIILGVDRLDYTKGIDLRLKAFSELLARSSRTVRDVVYVQVAVPSRARVAQYQALRGEVEGLVGKINGQFGEVGQAAVHYIRRNQPFEELVALYRAADVMLVTPYCDGMNLVAKEYVATRFDNSGVLILSEFAGATAELRGALLVNPHDVDGLAEAMHAGLSLATDDQRKRMQSMRRIVEKHTVHEWARSFMRALAAE